MRAATGSAEIAIRGVSKTFRGKGRPVWALSDVSLAVERGEFLCLVGRSGCGKSTLLEIVAGLQRPSQGQVTLGGREVSGPTPEAGLVFQRSSLFPWLNVADNLRFALEARGLTEGAQARIDRLIELVGLRGFERTMPDQLSGGMAQRVALARTLAAEAKVLLFDEPFSALDAFTRAGLQTEIERVWRQSGFTAMFVTHDIEEAVFLGSRVAIMAPAPGRIQKLVEVDLPRPRQRTTPRFLQLCAEILKELHEDPVPASDYTI